MDQNHLGIHQRRLQSFLAALVFIPYYSLGTERASSQAKKPFYSQALMLASPTWAYLSVESLVTSVGQLLPFGLS